MYEVDWSRSKIVKVNNGKRGVGTARKYPLKCTACDKEQWLRKGDILHRIENHAICWNCNQKIKGQISARVLKRKYGRKAFLHIIRPSLLRRKPSKDERKVARILKAMGFALGVGYEREYIVDGMYTAEIVDFYLYDYCLAIEVNNHFTHQDPRRDKQKAARVRRHGVSLLVLWQDQIKDKELSKKLIERAIKRAKRRIERNLQKRG